MRPQQLTDLLAKTIPAGLATLITGAPGIGKSDIVAQACKKAGADLILSHPVVADPTDAKGLPWAVAGAEEATFLPFGDLATAKRATKRTVWFLDDLGQAAPAVQASHMQLILARRVNGHILPDCITFIAATNRRTDRAGVSGILEPVKSRFASIIELDTHIDDWSAWALGSDIPAEIIAFLRFRPELLNDFKPSADLTNSPMPRTWAHAAKLMALGLPAELQHQAIRGAVGEGAASEFSAFLRLWEELPNIDGILLDPMASKIPSKPATLYAVVTALGMKANVKNFDRIARYAQRLVDGGLGEFAALLTMDCYRRDAAICQTKAFVKLAVGELGQLVGGGIR
jgi:hypothetical protein